MHADKHALVETLRHYRRHILGPLFVEAADTIEELLNTVNAQKAEIDALLDQTEEVHCGDDSCPIDIKSAVDISNENGNNDD